MARVIHGMKLVSVEDAHIWYVAEHERPEERLECFASWGENTLDALRRSVRESREVYTVLGPRGLPLCIGGIAAVQFDGWWNPWLIGTTDILNCRVAFLRASLWWTDYFWTKYRKLRTWIDARYETSLKWAAWLGCEVRSPAPYGVNGALFREVRLDWEARS